MKSRIALNGRFSRAHHPSGTQVASFHLFDAILREPREVDITVFADPEYPGVRPWADLPRTTLVPVPFRRWSRARCQLWEQVCFPGAARQAGCRLAHHPMNTSPACPGSLKSIVTLHDLNFFLHPEWYRRIFCWSYRWLALPGLRRASRVVVISNYVREQAERVLRIPAPRLRVIPNGLVPLPGAEPVRGAPPFVFCVGSYQPHKNLARLIDAHQRLRRQFGDLELWIAGLPEKRFRFEAALGRRLTLPGVKRLGFLSPAELSAHYQSAALFCFPSMEEGFGLPILEAMSLGTPVVTSNTSCLPETAGEAAVLVDPRSVESLAEGMEKVLRMSPPERETLLQKGRDRAHLFAWGVAALEYLRLYEEVLAE